MKLVDLKVGDKFFWKNQKSHPFTVKARDQRYLIATRPIFGKTQYTIIDTKEMVCGPDNYIFGVFDYGTQEGIDKSLIALNKGEFEISSRYGAYVNECIYGLEDVL